MEINFDLTDNYALNFEGQHIDLHNNFDFFGFEYNVEEKEIVLNWKKSSGDWVSKDELSGLVLIHKAVSFWKVLGQGKESNNDDESCLREITFFPSSSREINDSLIIQSKPNKGDDILYFFENGLLIRIHSEQIELQVNVLNEISGNNFNQSKLTEEEAFWIMRNFLEGHYELADGEFNLSDILSATQPFEFNDKGHFDGEGRENRRIAPADSGMVWHWNEAIKKFRKEGKPKPTPLKK